MHRYLKTICLSALLISAAGGCANNEKSEEPEKERPPVVCRDADGDGHGYGCDPGPDCNDDDPESHTLFDAHRDADGDGYGEDRSSKVCAGAELPEGYLAEGGDCDDLDRAVNPEAGEIIYNGIDDDCDQTTPDDDLDGDGYPKELDCDDSTSDYFNETETWLDADDDGYGAGDPVLFCGPVPLVYAYVPGDCIDTNPSANPGEAETPYNGVDDDCDAATSDNDLDGDGFAVPADCNDTAPEIYPLAPEADDRVDRDCDGDADELSDFDLDSDGRTPAGGDCDDGDPNNFQSCNSCLDEDGDGAWLGCDLYLSISGPDCAPLDPLSWDDCGRCIDADGDRRGVRCNAGPDCDDADPSVTDACPFCVDADGDGRNGQNINYCPGGDDYCEGDPDNYSAEGCANCIDADGDGYGAGCDAGPDCDDSPNGVACHTGCLSLFADADGDGYGDSARPIASCAAMPGAVDNSLDCDDSVERGAGCHYDCATYYPDRDADGFGDSSAPRAYCTAPPRQTTTAGDYCDLDYSNYSASGCDNCADSDGDNHYSGCDSYLYLAGPDCDDGSPDHYSDCGACTDADGDGRGTGCDHGPDCNDADELIFEDCPAPIPRPLIGIEVLPLYDQNGDHIMIELSAVPEPLAIEVGVSEDINSTAPDSWRTANHFLFDSPGEFKYFARARAPGWLDSEVFSRTYKIEEAQYPYPPSAGGSGSDAIAKDDPSIVAWASGYRDYQPGPGLIDSWKDSNQAIGPAEGNSFNVVSLGEGGSITISFASPIADHAGADFAVFENSFSPGFLDLAFVEVSDDCVRYLRFDSIYLYDKPVAAFGAPLSAAMMLGLAGRHVQGYGTPFDLADLADKPLVAGGGFDLGAITCIRIIDIVGCNPVSAGDQGCTAATTDSFGLPIYDPFPGSESAGFDLDAIAVINEGLK